MIEQQAPERLSSTAIEKIKAYIDESKLSPGARLPSERELCERLGISRSSVREALRVLETADLIEIRPRSGAYVKAADGAGMQVPLWPWLSTHTEMARQTYELRELIEPGAAALAAERAEAGELAALRQALDEMETCMQHGNFAGVILADAWFHHIVTRAAHNPYLGSLMDNVVQVLEQVRKASLSVPGLSERALFGHRQIYDAIARRDGPAAAAAMSEHLHDNWLYIARELDSATGK